MELYVQSLAASRVDIPTATWIPKHAVWMEFGPSHDHDRSVMEAGIQRTNATYPGGQGWIGRPCKLLRLGVEWTYAIMKSEEWDERVFALSLSAVERVLHPRSHVPFQLVHAPCLVHAVSVADARRQGIQQAKSWWPQDRQFVSWGVHIWPISASWFNREVQSILARGIFTTQYMERSYASAA